MPDPLEQYGRIAQIQQAQNQNALAQYQINSAKRADETNTNFLSSLRAAGDDPAKVRQALMMAGKVKEAGEFDVSALTRQKTQNDIRRQQRENVDRMKLDLSKNPSNENITAYMQDIDDDPTFSPSAKAIAKRGLNEMLGMTVDQRKQSLLTSGMTGAEMSKAALDQQKLVAPKIMQIERPDGGKIFVDENPNSPTFKQEILPSQAAGMTPYQSGVLNVSRQNLGVAQGNQRLAQEKFAWEKANPGKTIKEVEQADGTIQIFGIDNRTGIATPVKLAGAPGPAMPGQGRPAVDGGVALTGKKPPSATAEKTAVSEQQAAYNIGRVLTAANQIKEIGKKDPDSAQPGAAEALASSVGMGGTANLARNANRQIVQGAQRDALDALLYLATGAAYNKEQLQGQMDAYIPAFTDKDEAVAAKKLRMANLIQSAKVRAGKAWTPEMDRAMTALTGSDAAPAPAGGGGEWKVVK
jgi:hypothetical protein